MRALERLRCLDVYDDARDADSRGVARAPLHYGGIEQIADEGALHGDTRPMSARMDVAMQDERARTASARRPADRPRARVRRAQSGTAVLPAEGERSA